MVDETQRWQVRALAGEELAGRRLELGGELGALRRPPGDERRQKLVPCLEIGRPAVGREQVTFLRQNAVQLEMFGEAGRTKEERRAIEEAPAPGGGAGDEVALGLAPGDDRQQRKVLGDRRWFVLQRQAATLGGVGDREVPGPVAQDFRLDEKALLAARAALGECRGAEALAGRGEVDRLEEAALAGAVRAVNQIEARLRPPVGRRERAKAGQPEPAEVLERGGLGAQMRIGMMTQR